MVMVVVVPGYSGGTATELHRFPYSSHPVTSWSRTPESLTSNILPRPKRMSTITDGIPVFIQDRQFRQ